MSTIDKKINCDQSDLSGNPSKFVVDLKNSQIEKQVKYSQSSFKNFPPQITRLSEFSGESAQGKARTKNAFYSLTIVNISYLIYRLLRIIVGPVLLFSYYLGYFFVSLILLLFEYFKFNRSGQNSQFADHRPIPASAIKSAENIKLDFVKQRAVKTSTLQPAKVNIATIKNYLFSFDFGLLLPKPGIPAFKKAIVFMLIAYLVTLPFQALSFYRQLDIPALKGKVLGISEDAFQNLKSAGENISSNSYDQAEQYFNNAANDFVEAQNELDKINNILLTLARAAPDKEIKLAAYGKDMLRAGEEISFVGKELSALLSGVFDPDPSATEGVMNASSSLNKISLQQFFEVFDAKYLVINEHVGILNDILKQIPVNIAPGEYQAQFGEAQKLANNLVKAVGEFGELVHELYKVMGGEQDKRYLVAFQNNTEMRGSGGFIGSFALLDFSKGSVKNLEAPGGGSYDTEAGLKEMILAPEPLHLLKTRWYFWDANWWPDWPTAARKLMWFYEKSDGPTVDGVIALTPTVMERMLRALGPIDMTEKYGIVVDHENFWETVQTISEYSGQESNTPKLIIGDLMEKMFNEIPGRLDSKKIVELFTVLGLSMDEKHILLYFSDTEIQSEIAKYGWDGKLKSTSRDYLMVANTNIGGGKSDKGMRQTIDHAAEIKGDGTVIDTLRITREHTSGKGEEFTGVRNNDWMRVYVPLGAELIEASGFDVIERKYFKVPEGDLLIDPDIANTEARAITDPKSGTKIYIEAGKTVFANWSVIDPGQTKTITIKYKLPFRMDKTIAPQNFLEQIEYKLNPDIKLLHPYSLLVQKQPGSLNTRIVSKLIAAENFRLIWKYPQILDAKTNGWQADADLNVDRYWAAIFEK